MAKKNRSQGITVCEPVGHYVSSGNIPDYALDLIGMTISDACLKMFDYGLVQRSVVVNGVKRIVTLENCPNRLNIEEVDGIVTKIVGIG